MLGHRFGLARVFLVAVRCFALFAALSAATPAVSAVPDKNAEKYVGRPIYSEPATGLQLPPGCAIEPTWRARISTSDNEVWLVTCSGVARAWLLRRAVLEVLSANSARVRFQVLDEELLPGETVGDTASVQCTGNSDDDVGLVVVGAKWRAVGTELRLVSAQRALRVDLTRQKLVSTPLARMECTRYPEREAMMRRLQNAR
jgi:hypothetical protein